MFSVRNATTAVHYYNRVVFSSYICLNAKFCVDKLHLHKNGSVDSMIPSAVVAVTLLSFTVTDNIRTI